MTYNYKCVLTEGQKVLLCQFKINISPSCTASTNQIVVKQRRMKSERDTVQQVFMNNFVYIYTIHHMHRKSKTAQKRKKENKGTPSEECYL